MIDEQDEEDTTDESDTEPFAEVAERVSRPRPGTSPPPLRVRPKKTPKSHRRRRWGAV